MRKRLFGIALMLVLAVTLICFGTGKAEAASTHTHPVCGKTCGCSNPHSSATWRAWDGTTKMYSGYYYLTEDIVLDSTMILDYSYSTVLCLNGHRIYCDETVFDIYNYRSIGITDCVGTGKIESVESGFGTISNNGSLCIWGGTVLNSGTSYGHNAIVAWSGSTTYVKGGCVESTNNTAVYLDVGSKVYIEGGTLHGKYGATEAVGGSGTPSQLTISGGRLTADHTDYGAALDIGSGSFRMTGGYVEGVFAWNDDGATVITGGTINGYSDFTSDSLSINAGTFGGRWHISGTDNSITGGNFAGCEEVVIQGQAWICGGSYSILDVEDGPLYLSGVPEIKTLKIWKPGMVYAQSQDGSGSFGGEPVEILLSTSATTWKDGDIVIKNVKSDVVASRFTLMGPDSEWMYLEHVNNNLVLRIIPHGTWGNATWSVWEDRLTISGTGVLDYAISGSHYPWGDYHDEIKMIVVESGITEIPSYAFEYCEQATEIVLPDTLENLWLNAFNDCGSLNNLVLPASLVCVNGSSNTGNPAFIRCESLTEVYYLGTQAHWAQVNNGSRVESHNSEMTLHFLQLQPGTATCTQAGTAPYYQFDNTAVYSGLYDLNLQPITQPAAQSALGHDTVYHQGKEPTSVEGGWEPYETCTRCDYTTFEELPPIPVVADINNDGSVDNDDVVKLLWGVLFPSQNPISVNGDLNRDGYVDNADVLLLLWHILFPEKNPI